MLLRPSNTKLSGTRTMRNHRRFVVAFSLCSTNLVRQKTKSSAVLPSWKYRLWSLCCLGKLPKHFGACVGVSRIGQIDPHDLGQVGPALTIKTGKVGVQPSWLDLCSHQGKGNLPEHSVKVYLTLTNRAALATCQWEWSDNLPYYRQQPARGLTPLMVNVV